MDDYDRRPERPESDIIRQVQPKNITTRVLEFLSTASNETLGACLAGLAAVTYLFLGRLGLLLMGAAGGIVLHATWVDDHRSEHLQHMGNGNTARNSANLNIVAKILDWQEDRTSRSSAENSREDIRTLIATQNELSFDNFRPATAAALQGFVNAVVDNYVKLVSPFAILRKRLLIYADGGILLFYHLTSLSPLLAVNC